jgi:hypothetical protein
MLRARALYIVLFIVSIGALAFLAHFAPAALDREGAAQSVEAADLPAKIEDRAPRPVLLELRAVAPAVPPAKASSAALPAIRAAEAGPQSAQHAGSNLWSYNGSVLQRESAGRIRRFYYAGNREGSAAKSGELLFEGVREGPVISGQAFAFSENCPPLAYQVKGSVNADETIVKLRGKQPRRDDRCNASGLFDAELILSSIQYRVIRAKNDSAPDGWQQTVK